MPKNYATPILDGDGDNDYARYMRTDTLLALQRPPEERVHRDELLFQVVHQSTELWLKLASEEATEAGRLMERDAVNSSKLALDRSTRAVQLITEQLEMLTHLTPWVFQTIRTVLGHGSGFESPGWGAIQHSGKKLRRDFDTLVVRQNVDLLALYQGDPGEPMYQLAEALIEWDERVSLWRARHYKVATRIIGHDVVGTKGAGVDTLTRLITAKFFPELWRVRTELTRTGPMATDA